MKIITFEDGIMRLGGDELPGILQNLRVDGRLRYDEQKVDGVSGKKKTPKGWEDQVLTATLLLTTDEDSDCYEKLEVITPFFRTPDAKANPQIYTFANRHALTRGIRQVVFDRLESYESHSTDEIRVTVGFTEHNPPIVKTERNAAKTPTPGEVAEQNGEGPEEDDAILSGDLS